MVWQTVSNIEGYAPSCDGHANGLPSTPPPTLSHTLDIKISPAVSTKRMGPRLSYFAYTPPLSVCKQYGRVDTPYQLLFWRWSGVPPFQTTPPRSPKPLRSWLVWARREGHCRCKIMPPDTGLPAWSRMVPLPPTTPAWPRDESLNQPPF